MKLIFPIIGKLEFKWFIIIEYLEIYALQTSILKEMISISKVISTISKKIITSYSLKVKDC